MFERVRAFHAHLRGYRTLMASGAVSLAGSALMFYDSLKDFGVDFHEVVGDAVPAQKVGVVFFGMGMVFAFLRFVTTTKMFCKPCQEEHHE